jgi:hypothetical protein
MTEHYDPETGTYSRVDGDFDGIQAGQVHGGVVINNTDDDDGGPEIWISGQQVR